VTALLLHHAMPPGGKQRRALLNFPHPESTSHNGLADICGRVQPEGPLKKIIFAIICFALVFAG